MVYVFVLIIHVRIQIIYDLYVKNWKNAINRDNIWGFVYKIISLIIYLLYCTLDSCVY